MALHITPETGVPLPYKQDDETPNSFAKELQAAALTMDAIERKCTIPVLPPEVDAAGAIEALEAALNTKNPTNLKSPAVASAAKDFLRKYAERLAIDAADVRAALTNKLLEIANCGDPRYELKAIELLGKHSDIALFTERSSMTVNYKTASELEDAIRTKIKNLTGGNARSAIPLTIDALDAELGTVDAEMVEDKDE